MDTHIFISYRRDDSSDVSGRIFDRLHDRYGDGHVFKDVDSIPMGDDFRTVIVKAVGNCTVFLAILGKKWLDASDKNGQRRLENQDDFVRIEVETGLRRDVLFVPVLVQDSHMPDSSLLPESIRDLCFRNAAKVRPDPDFHSDMSRLIERIDAYLGISKPATKSATSSTETQSVLELIRLIRLTINKTLWDCALDNNYPYAFKKADGTLEIPVKSPVELVRGWGKSLVGQKIDLVAELSTHLLDLETRGVPLDPHLEQSLQLIMTEARREMRKVFPQTAAFLMLGIDLALFYLSFVYLSSGGLGLVIGAFLLLGAIWVSIWGIATIRRRRFLESVLWRLSSCVN